MDDLDIYDLCVTLDADQIATLATEVREAFGSNLGRATFEDRVLMLLEDVSGFEGREAPALTIQSVWAEYARQNQDQS